MTTKKETAGKTAKKRAAGRNVTRKGNKANRRITLTIEGEHYDTLERIAQAMNTVSWCTNKNTPETVFDAFVWPIAEDLLDSPAELRDMILDGISTGDDYRRTPGPVHDARIAELDKAFADL